MFHALRNRNYRLFWYGSVVSNTGTWMQRIAQDWLVLQLTSSGTALGITTALQFLPVLLFGLQGGVLADRLPKRQILLVTQTVMGLAALVLGLLEVAGVVQVWHVYLLAAVLGLGAAFDNPARQSFVIEMVGKEDLSNAIGLNATAFNMGRVVGPAVAGLLISASHQHTGPVFLINAASFLAILVALGRMRESELEASPRRSAGKGALREGLRYVRSNREVRTILLVTACFGTFGMNFSITTALMAKDVYGKGAGGYGLLGTVMAVGSLTGALLAARREAPQLKVFLAAVIAFGVLESVSGLMPSYVSFAVVLVPLGLTSITALNTANALLQTRSDPVMRGRVLSLHVLVVFGTAPLVSPLIGWVGEEFGARWSLSGGGVLSLVGGVAGAVYLGRQRTVPVAAVEPEPVAASAA
ncbi:putative MFS family arabinose efflux permease [Motilibacter rhizosphaerae]|uniref:Putative MFS family arabinose efflux permease n=1 Tax=Motilibacter rhizosphaerae TaxID=598652 RepID=A0A4Q7NQX2_9ACTN|nr:MFS transporter [Motilibacter rhizosphaerae]RZS87508.1 putative MFS family arabinose efflux permease [Motilibacter rhizosphaerae]